MLLFAVCCSFASAVWVFAYCLFVSSLFYLLICFYLHALFEYIMHRVHAELHRYYLKLIWITISCIVHTVVLCRWIGNTRHTRATKKISVQISEWGLCSKTWNLFDFNSFIFSFRKSNSLLLMYCVGVWVLFPQNIVFFVF